VTEPELFEQLLAELERREAAHAAARKVMGEAKALHAPAGLSESDPLAGTPPAGGLAKAAAWLARPDRVVGGLASFAGRLAHALVLGGGCLAVKLCAAAILAVVLQLVLPAPLAVAITLPFAAAATAGTFVDVWRALREEPAEPSE
jgi:hypothetical protein